MADRPDWYDEMAEREPEQKQDDSVQFNWIGKLITVIVAVGVSLILVGVFLRIIIWVFSGIQLW